MHPLVKSGNSHQLLWSVLVFFLKKKTIMVRLFPSQASIIHRDQVTSRLLQNKRVKIGLLPEKKKKFI